MTLSALSLLLHMRRAEVNSFGCRRWFAGEQVLEFTATDLRKEELVSQLGIWPLFSMINHSCLPNAVQYTLRPEGYMFVRASRPIAAGEEVCICYLEQGPVGQPMAERQTELMNKYGFVCNCPRWDKGGQLAEPMGFWYGHQ